MLQIFLLKSKLFIIDPDVKLVKNSYLMNRWLYGIFLPNLIEDPVTKEQRTDTIYSIPCNDCDMEYIKQTKRQFDTRLKEHQQAVFFCLKKENSALSEHTCLTS